MVAGVGGDHQQLRAVLLGGSMRSLDDKARADPAPPVRGLRIDSLEAAAASGDNDAAAGNNLRTVGVQSDVPRTTPEPKESPQIFQPPAAVFPVGHFVEALVAAGNLERQDLLPQVFIDAGGRLERPHSDVPVLARMRANTVRRSDQADCLLELVPARHELLARTTERTINTIPPERQVRHPRVAPELALEPFLPSGTITGDGRIVEQQ